MKIYKYGGFFYKIDVLTVPMFYSNITRKWTRTRLSVSRIQTGQLIANNFKLR